MGTIKKEAEEKEEKEEKAKKKALWLWVHKQIHYFCLHFLTQTDEMQYNSFLSTFSHANR